MEGVIEYHSRFFINLTDRSTYMVLGLFEVNMRVEMTNGIFNDFIPVINQSMGNVLNLIRSEEYTDDEKMTSLEEAFHQIRNFFGEDADVILDLNLRCRGLMTAIYMSANFIDPIIEFMAPLPEPRMYAHSEITFGETDQLLNLFIRSGVMT